jgi:hypothetical protein
MRRVKKELVKLRMSSPSDCGRSASEEMPEQRHDPDYQHDVNEAAGNVKSKEPTQPKNNQDRSDYSCVSRCLGTAGR